MKKTNYFHFKYKLFIPLFNEDFFFPFPPFLIGVGPINSLLYKFTVYIIKAISYWIIISIEWFPISINCLTKGRNHNTHVTAHKLNKVHASWVLLNNWIMKMECMEAFWVVLKCILLVWQMLVSLTRFSLIVFFMIE